MRQSGNTTKDYHNVIASCEDIALPVVKLKHASNFTAPCKGIVIEGRCKHCGEFVPGVPAYSTTVSLQSMNTDLRIKVTASEKWGNVAFGLDAGSFHLLSREEKEEKYESVQCVKTWFKLMVQYDLQKNDLFVCIIAMKVLPRKKKFKLS